MSLLRRLLWFPVVVVAAVMYWTLALGLGMGSLTWLDQDEAEGAFTANVVDGESGQMGDPGEARAPSTSGEAARASEPILVHLVSAPEAPTDAEPAGDPPPCGSP